MLQITELKYHKKIITELAQYLHNEFGKYHSNGSLEERKERLIRHSNNSDSIPKTYIAFSYD